MVNFVSVRDLARKELVETIDQYAGKKVRSTTVNAVWGSCSRYLVLSLQILVWDESLIGPMDLVAGFAFLRERQVSRMLPLRPGRLAASPASGSADSVVFVVRPEVELMRRVADNIRG